MFRIIHPNRWFFWTISLTLIIGLWLLLFIYQAGLDIQKQADSTLWVSSEDSSDHTYSGWKIFRSPVLGISIKYPPSWQIEIDPLEPTSVSLENPKKFAENVSISVRDQKLEKVIRDSLKVSESREIVVGGQPGVWLKGGDTRDQATSNVVLVKKGNKLFYIAGQAVAFEKIISGIRFLQVQ